jgi:hypothetical protein
MKTFAAGGFMEEAIFRGLVLRALLPGGLVRAAVLSSLIFRIQKQTQMALSVHPIGGVHNVPTTR